MPQAIRILGWGFIISFIGTLPLGTLSISAMQIAITDGVPPAISFSLGAIMAEMIYVRMSLVAMNWVKSHEKFLKTLEWATVVIVMALAASSFWAALHPSVPKNVLLSDTMHRGLLGLLMSAINPMQIPFWFGWSAVLFSKNILRPGFWNYNAYLLGIGTGTFMAHCLFMFGGRWLGEQLNSSQHYMNWGIGFIFLVTGVIQLIKIYTKKDAIHQLEHPEEVTGGLEKKIQ